MAHKKMVNKTKTITLLLILLTILLAPNIKGALVGYWDFEEGTGTTAIDQSGYKNNGTHDNGTYVTGKVGTYAYNYSLPSRTNIPLISEYNGSSEWTTTIWVKKTTTSSSAEHPLYLHESLATKTNMWRIGIWSSDNTLHGCGFLAGLNWVCINTSIQLNEWYYVALTIENEGSNSNITLWINGEINKTTTQANLWITQNAYSVASGGFPIDNDGFANATIDEFAMWNHTLTQEEITELYNESNGKRADQLGAYTNITVTAQSAYNQTSINTFNATINSITYGTTTGTITGPTQGPAYTIQVYGPGWQTSTYTDWNTNNTLTANLTHTSMAVTSNWSYTSTYVGNTINLNCSYTTPTSHTITPNYIIKNIDDGYQHNQTTTTYTINTTDFLNNLTYYCQACTPYECNNGTQKSIAQDIINNKLYIYVYDYLSELVSSILIKIPEFFAESNDNPSITNLNWYINRTNNTAYTIINITDTGLKNRQYQAYINITDVNNTFNITLSPNQLVLNFSGTTNGLIADNTSIQNFTQQQYIIQQENLSLGDVLVAFNHDTENYTQFYEYINDQTTHVFENIKLLNNSKVDIYAYLLITDEGNSPLEDVTIRAYFEEPTGGAWKTYKLMGQRMTDGAGMTLFYFDSTTVVKLVISKDGYTTESPVILIGDTDAPKDDPLVFVLSQANTISWGGNTVYLPLKFTNRSKDILGGIYAPNKDSVKFTTNYMITNSLGNNTLTGDSMDRYAINLTPNSHFSSTGTDNIIVHFWTDGIYYKNYTITYDTTTYQNITTTSDLEDLDTTTKDILLFIGLILISTVAGLIFRKNGTAGFTVFMIGSMFITIFSMNFAWLTLIAVMWAILRIIHKVTAE